jgi:hypothetical protein
MLCCQDRLPNNYDFMAPDSAGLIPGPFGNNESDCEPVHICSTWRLLIPNRWGFEGPGDRRRRDTIFRARRLSFFKPSLLARPCNARSSSQGTFTAGNGPVGRGTK